MSINKLLKRQIEKYLGKDSPVPKEMQSLFSAVNDAYDGFDKDRELVERSLDLSSKEFRSVTAQFQESEKRFHSLVDNIPGSAYRCAVEYPWPIHYISDGIERISGYTAMDFAARRMHDYAEIVIPEDLESIKTVIAKGVRDQTPYEVEYRIRCADKNTRWVYERGNAIYDEQGNPMWLDGVIFDVTKRKKAEEALLREKNISDALIASLPGVFYLFPEGGSFVRWNKHFEQTTGYTSDEVDKMHPLDLFRGEDRQRVAERILEVFTTGESSVEASIVTKSGEAIPYYFTGVLIDIEGVPHTTGVGVDITERKEAEEEIKSANAFLDTVIDMSPFAMWISDRDGTVMRTNKSLRDALRLNDEQITGKYNVLKDLNLEHQGVMPMVKAVFENCEPAQFTILWKAAEVGVDFKGGRDLFIDVSIFPITDAEGKLTNVVCQWVDITERKRSEEKLAVYSETLEEMVAERTKKLEDAQEKLVTKEKLAVLGQLAGGIGHELRNPLGVISNAAYLLQATLPDVNLKTQSYLNIITSQVSIAERSISDLFHLTKTQPVSKERVSIHRLISQALENYPPPDGVNVIDDMNSDMPRAFVDPVQAEHALTNLIVNAYQAMPEGGNLTIRGRIGDDGMVAISFIDTGCGISEENMDKLCEPLFTTKPRGIGLGLTVTKNLVEINGGRIEVISERGKGSTFIITLPTNRKRS